MARKKKDQVADAITEIVRPRRQKEIRQGQPAVTRRTVLLAGAKAGLLAGVATSEVVPLKDRTPKDGPAGGGTR